MYNTNLILTLTWTWGHLVWYSRSYVHCTSHSRAGGLESHAVRNQDYGC